MESWLGCGGVSNTSRSGGSDKFVEGYAILTVDGGILAMEEKGIMAVEGQEDMLAAGLTKIQKFDHDWKKNWFCTKVRKIH